MISRGLLQPQLFGDPVKHLMILLSFLNWKIGFQNYQYLCDILQVHVFEKSVDELDSEPSLINKAVTCFQCCALLCASKLCE